jgi:hypothetical protein
MSPNPSFLTKRMHEGDATKRETDSPTSARAVRGHQKFIFLPQARV